MRELLFSGDLADYCGRHQPLMGRRLLVVAISKCGRRVRGVVRLDSGATVERIIKRDNLKRVRGG